MNQIYLSIFVFVLSSSQICMYTSNNTICNACISGYYLSNNTCQSCSILYCTVCSNNTTCSQCQNSYTLINNSTCYYCPKQYYFNGTCNACISNCLYCSNDTNCIQCLPGYYFNNTNCSQTTNFDNLTTIDLSIIKSYFLNIPSLANPILTRKDLMFNCLNNGFVCTCSSNNLNSVCQTINNTIILNKFYIQNFTTINTSNIFAYSWIVELNLNDTENIMNKLFIFINNTFNNNLNSNLNYLQTVLSIYGKLNYTYDNYQNLSYYISNISKILNDNINSSNSNNILLQGNGFIFSFSILQNQIYSNPNYTTFQVSYQTQQNGYDYQFVIFDKLINDYAISGTYFMGDNFTSPVNRTLILPSFNSLNYYNTLQAYDQTTPKKPVIINNISILSNDNNTITISNFKFNKSTIFMVNGTITNSYDPYIAIRIQNIFYQTSIFYILFFLLLYLLFISLCLLIDFVDQTKQKKNQAQRQPTQQGLHPDPPSENSNQSQVENVTYKQFFPIYNIAATPNRGSRIIKLLLYLLNLQHSITFLVLLYTPVPKLAIWAILLAIPVYLMNITMSYIVGFIKNRLPAYWKLLINLLVPVYWTIWYIFMKNLVGDFQTYVLIFTIVIFVLDFLFDMLQMMIMYFILKEKNDTYNCISKILSERGYFQYSKYVVD